MRTSLRTALVSTVASIGLVAAAVSGAGAGAPGEPVVQVQPNPVVVGETVTLTVTGWDCGGLIDVDVYSGDEFLFSLEPGGVDDGGSAQLIFAAPDTPGLYLLDVYEDEGSRCDTEVALNVIAPVDTTVETTVPVETTTPEEPTTTVESILPPTGGGESTPWVALIALALLVGGAVVVVRTNVIRRHDEAR